MSYRHLGLVGGILLGLAGTILAQNKPVYYNEALAANPKETTLADRIAAVDAALRVKVVSEGRAQVPPTVVPGSVPFVSTAYEVEVLDGWKLSPLAGAVGSRITMVQGGGEVDLGAYRVHSDGTRHEFAVGEEYLVFLTRDSRQGELWVSPADVFLVRDGKIEPTAHAKGQLYAPELAGLTVVEAAAKMRMLIEELDLRR